MNDLEYEFEESPWEQYLNSLPAGGSLKALTALSMLEDMEEEEALECLEGLDGRGIRLDIADLPAVPAGQAAVRLKHEAEFVRSGMRLNKLEAGDPLRLYLEEIAQLPAWGDETVLLAEFAGGKESAAAALVNLGLSRVVELAASQAGKGVLLLDLIQEGSLGLWNAISSYTAGAYEAHRDLHIGNSIARAITMQARANGLGQRIRREMEDYRAVDERLLGDLGRNPSLEEIALELHVSPEEADVIRKMVEDARRVNMALKPEPEEIPEEENQAVEDTAYFQMRSRIMELLSVLDEKEAKLISLRYGLEGGLPLSAAEVGNRLGMTPGEVSAREAQVLAKLREEK